MNNERKQRNNSIVIDLEKENFQLWDRLVSTSPQGTIFHSSEWITKCASLSNKKYLMLGFFENDELLGGCSLFVTNRFKYFKFATSVAPLTPYGGFLLPLHISTKIREREIQNNSIISSIIDSMTKYKFKNINLVNSPEFLDIRPLTWHGWIPRINYTYILPLVGDISEKISKNVRRSVRKAEKYNIRHRKYYDTKIFWQLISDTYQKQNQKPPLSNALLVGLLDLIKGKKLGEMWVAETGSGETASAEFIIWDSKMTYRLAAASNPRFTHTGATSFLLFEIFKDLQKRGFNKINLMAGNVPHLSNFISSFNPLLVPYYVLERSSGIYNIYRRLL